MYKRQAGGNVRQYRKEDIENIRLVYHLVKEKGVTLQGAKQKLKMNRETTLRTTEILDRLKLIREELVSMRKELDYQASGATWRRAVNACCSAAG